MNYLERFSRAFRPRPDYAVNPALNLAPAGRRASLRRRRFAHASGMRLSCSRTLRRTWFLAFVLLAGCAYNPSDHYDPDAIEKRGLIVAKKVARTEPVQSGETNPPLFLPLPGVLVVLPARPIESTGRMNVYEHVVKLSPSETVSVLSEYPGFNVGDCVKVFLSQRASYPRIAQGSGCEK